MQAAGRGKSIKKEAAADAVMEALDVADGSSGGSDWAEAAPLTKAGAKGGSTAFQAPATATGPATLKVLKKVQKYELNDKGEEVVVEVEEEVEVPAGPASLVQAKAAPQPHAPKHSAGVAAGGAKGSGKVRRFCCYFSCSASYNLRQEHCAWCCGMFPMQWLTCQLDGLHALICRAN